MNCGEIAIQNKRPGNCVHVTNLFDVLEEVSQQWKGKISKFSLPIVKSHAKLEHRRQVL